MEFEPRWSAAPVTDVIRPLRGAYAITDNRGGVLHTLTFSRVVDHGDIVTAQRSLATLAETFQNLEGAATIEFKAGAFVHSMANASLGPWDAQAKHQFTFHTLRIQGGQMTTTT